MFSFPVYERLAAAMIDALTHSAMQGIRTVIFILRTAVLSQTRPAAVCSVA